MKIRTLTLTAACTLALTGLPAAAQQQGADQQQDPAREQARDTETQTTAGGNQANTEAEQHDQVLDDPVAAADAEAGADAEYEDQTGAMEDATEAANILTQMQQDEAISGLIDQAQGLFIVPDYAAAALIVGGSGGEGVLITREGGEWSHPGFYDIGSASLGVQAGVSAGSIAMLLMSEEAVNSFNNENVFALNAQAGLSVINWSTRAQGTTGELDQDVVVWTDTEGLLGELSVGFTDINWDEEENQEYYGELIMPQQVIGGTVQTDRENPFRQQLGG